MLSTEVTKIIDYPLYHEYPKYIIKKNKTDMLNVWHSVRSSYGTQVLLFEQNKVKTYKGHVPFKEYVNSRVFYK